MKRLFVICEPFEVVAVPFPFSDTLGSKRRPALVLSQRSFNEYGHSILAMITTQTHPSWPGDISIKDQQIAGLRIKCIIRLKLFTLDNRLIAKRIGRVSEADKAAVVEQLRLTLAVTFS